MSPDDLKTTVQTILWELRRQDPAYRWVMHQIARERARHDFYRRLRSTVLGHLIVIVAAALAIGVWELWSRNP